jgi:hypothetical protein
MVLAVASAAITSTAASTIAPASAASATTSAPASAPTTVLLRTSFIHYQGASQKIPPVQTLDRFHRVRIVSNFSESKSAWLVGDAVAQQTDCVGLDPYFREQRCDLIFGSFKRQISQIQFLHGRSP